MNSERYARLKEIFLTAAALPGPERPGYLDEACSGDSGMRAEVDAMLAHRDAPAEVLKTGALASLAASAFGEARSPRGQIPERIGPCRILGILGEGGMGVVYRAEQEHPVRREVALKLIRGGASSASVLARFDAERQVLAMMDHPNIARLYDAGATEDGRPYFLMEMIRGAPLNEYVRTRRLDLRARLEMFRLVCGAVRHAHRRGVIHRDLKPSNILVSEAGGEPQPKIIDFSIAKALTEPIVGAEHRTREGQLVGTLEYMAPEQAMGRVEAVDTRTDVYALGVILYELIADRLPIEISGLPLHEAIRKIAEDPPRIPGTTRSGTAGAVSIRIDPDLATIVGKCLEKEPDRRYGSAAELVEDVERYLASRPIAARPPTALYQFRKFVGRHVVSAASLAVLLVLLVGFAATTVAQLRQQRRARAAAELETKKAARIAAFHQRVLGLADPGKAGGRVTVRQALDRAAAEIDRGLPEDPEVQAEVHRVVGEGYAAVGAWPEAIYHFRAGLSDRRSIVADASAADLPSALILARLSITWNQLGDFRRARLAARLAASMGISLEGADSSVAATALLGSALAAHFQGLRAEAVADASRAVEIRARILPPNHADLAESHYILGMILDGEEGAAHLEKALRIQRRALGKDSSAYLATLNLLAGHIQRRGTASHEEIVTLRRRLLAEGARIHGAESGYYGMMANNLGLVLMERLDGLSEAERLFDEAYAIFSRRGESTPAALSALGNLAFVRACRGDDEGAAAADEEILARLRKAGQADVHASWKILANLGIAEHLLGRQGLAEEHLREGLGILKGAGGQDAAEGALAEGWLGCLLLETGRAAEAERRLRHALDRPAREEKPTGANGFLANTLARALAAQGRRAEGEATIEASRRFLLERTESPRELRHALEQSAKTFDAWGRREDAGACRTALRRLNEAARGAAGRSGTATRLPGVARRAAPGRPGP